MSIELLIEAIHASPVRLSLCICGAGAGVVRRLTRVAECSRTLLEANVLYHRSSTQAALDGLPRHIVSAEAARQLAQHAFHTARAIALAEAQQQQTPTGQLAARIPGLPTDLLFGIGATSAIKTSRTRHSTDRVHVCVWGGSVSASCGVPPCAASSHCDAGRAAALPPLGQVRDYHLEMPDWMSRAEQDEQVELMLLHAIACTVDACLPADTELINSGTRRPFPRTVFQTLLPSPGDDHHDRSGGVSASSSSPGLSMMADAARLCAAPDVSPPVSVCLDAASEVRQALTFVLEPGAGVSDVCVLWNRHGELRAYGMAPYVGDARVEASVARCEAPVVGSGANPLMEDASGEQSAESPVAAAAAAAATAAAAASASASAEAVKGIRLLYPGSFNPLHYGHTELVQAATRVLLERHHLHHLENGALPVPVEVTYEVAVKVVDKGAIPVEDLERRVCQFLRRGERVAVTAATLFVTKARLFPGHGFLIGIDTATRVLDAKYYSSHADPVTAESAMVDALTRDIGGRGCYFVVGGRKLSEAAGWQDLSSLRIPDRIRHLFVSVPPTEFRVDVSSTELRALRQGRGA